MNVYMEILEKEGNSSEVVSIVVEILVAVLCDDDALDEGRTKFTLHFAINYFILKYRE